MVALARHPFDQQRQQHEGGVAVVERGSGLGQGLAHAGLRQVVVDDAAFFRRVALRQPGRPRGGEVAGRVVADDRPRRRPPGFLRGPGTVVDEGVPEARRVRQHVAERDGGQGGLSATGEEAFLDVVREDLELDVPRVHALGTESALVGELDDEERGNRLADARGVKAVVRRHRLAGVLARDAGGVFPGEARRRRLDPGHRAPGAGRQLAFEQRVEIAVDARGGVRGLRHWGTGESVIASRASRRRMKRWMTAWRSAVSG